jgi:hypothetical protein
MPILADFHNHSCLSPCGSLEQSPRVLAERAASKGIGLLALTDHNSALNCPAFAVHCARLGLLPLFGVEATTAEEIHVLCLFGSLDGALAFGEHISALMPKYPNDPARMGDQVYVDAEDMIEGEVEYYLGMALEWGVDDIGAAVRNCGGLPIPAHVDRPSFSMTSQLGFVVDGPWAALECVVLPPRLDTRGYPLITSSDAHHPEHVGRRSFLLDAEADELCPGRCAERGAGHGPKGIDMAVLESALSRRRRE